SSRQQIIWVGAPAPAAPMGVVQVVDVLVHQYVGVETSIREDAVATLAATAAPITAAARAAKNLRTTRAVRVMSLRYWDESVMDMPQLCGCRRTAKWESGLLVMDRTQLNGWPSGRSRAA